MNTSRQVITQSYAQWSADAADVSRADTYFVIFVVMGFALSSILVIAWVEVVGLWAGGVVSAFRELQRSMREQDNIRLPSARLL